MDSINDIVRKLRENRILQEKADYNSMSRDELIKLAQEGDQLAVSTLVDTHQDFINKMSYKYFVSIGDKDDIHQMATIAFWEAIMSWDMTGEFEAYAGMLIRRKLADYVRSDNTEKSQMLSRAQSFNAPVAQDGKGGEQTLGDTLASKSGSAEDEYIGSSGAQEIMNWMEENLSDMELQTIKMYIDGYKVSQIAEDTGMKYKRVENAIARVKGKLSEYLRGSQRESRRVREARDLEFSDEEKQILRKAIGEVERKRHLQESRSKRKSFK